MAKGKGHHSSVFPSKNARGAKVLPRGMHSPPPVVISNSSRFLWDSDEPLSPPESSSRSISFQDLASRRCNALSIPSFKDVNLTFNNYSPYVRESKASNGRNGYQYHVGPRSIGWIQSYSQPKATPLKFMTVMRTFISRLNFRPMTIGVVVVILSLCIGTGIHYRTRKSTFSETSRYSAIENLIIERKISPTSSMQSSDGKLTPQLKALEWISFLDPLQLAVDSDEILPRYACAVLFYSTNMNENSGWLSSHNTCSWKGITCKISNGVMQITDINRSDHDTGGFLSREIFTTLHKSLVTFRWTNSSLGGTLPPEIGMPNLKVLSLHNNALSGTLPREIFGATSLELLSLYNNNFTGAIMDNFENMINLTALYLDYNYFSGTIPKSISMLSKLVDLRLRHNNLDGTIPSQLGELQKLQILFLDFNKLTGSIPNSFDMMTHLQYFHVHSNSLTSTIPFKNSLEHMVELIGNSNHFSGTISDVFARSKFLKRLWLANNDLTGEVPVSVCQNVKTQNLDLIVDCEKVICSCCQTCIDT
jgi:hypothetical protein